METQNEFTSPYISAWEQHYLIRGQQYRVIKPFTDADGTMHPIGEEWIFLSSNFSRYDDLRILSIRLPSSSNRLLQLRCIDGEQKNITDHFDDYVMRI